MSLLLYIQYKQQRQQQKNAVNTLQCKKSRTQDIVCCTRIPDRSEMYTKRNKLRQRNTITPKWPLATTEGKIIRGYCVIC